MSLFKRTFTGIYAKIDQLVGEIENHDALIQATINEQKNKLASAKVQLKKMQTQESRVKEQLKKLRENEQRWSSRATQEAATDEQRALSCLQRRQTVRRQIAKLEQIQYEYQMSAVKIKNDIQQGDDDLAAMIQKHQILRTRQSTADALRMIGEDRQTNKVDVESSFDRWEIKIAQGEFSSDHYAEEIDELEQEYLTEENELQLRSELAELLKEEILAKGNEQ